MTDETTTAPDDEDDVDQPDEEEGASAEVETKVETGRADRG